MKSRYMTRIMIAAVALALGSAPAMGFAQDVTESDRRTSDDLMDAASQRLADDAAAEEEREVEELEAQDELTLEDYEAAEEGLTPEELDQLQRQLEQTNSEMIAQLEDIIAGQPQSPQRPEWMFQKAELMWELRNMEYIRERNDYNACLDAVYDGPLEEEDCDEPEPEYGEPQEIYEQIVLEFPDYQRLDEVIFRLGSGLLDGGQGAEGVEYLNRLIADYPNSRYVPDSRLALGDYFFEQHMTGAAKDNYVHVLDHEEYRNYDYALYQLAWTNFNMGEWRDSADRFMEVIEREDDTSAWGLLADRAANDLILALAEIPGGWIEARDYFIDLRDREYAIGQMQRMAQQLEAQGNDPDAIATYDWLIEEEPNNPDVPDWADAITRTERENSFENYEERVIEFASFLHPDHTWYRNNEDDEQAIDMANRYVRNNLARLGTHYHSEAQDDDDMEKYTQAAEYYQQFIDRFPDDHISFDMTFFLGEIYLFSLEEYAQAAEQYQLVVDLYENDNVPEGADEQDVEEFVRDAAYNIVVSYNNLVRKHHPESILVKMAERAGEDPELTSDGIEGEIDADEEPDEVVREDLLEWEAGFVRASDQFAEMYPNDDITPTVDYVAAEVYRDRGHFDSCIPRYESIIENAPEHTYASYAGNSLLEANYRLQDWDQVEYWARHLMENEIFDVTPEESLTSAIAFAINQRAMEYMDEDQHSQGAEELLRLVEEFPDSDLASGALFNAAAVFEEGDEISRAVEIYQQVVDEYPDESQVPEALLALGQIHEARTDFARAADYYLRLSEEAYRDYRPENEEAMSAVDAVFNSAALRQAMEDWDDAIDTYELYLELFDDEIDDRQEVEYELAFLEQERDNWEASRDRFEDYLDSWGDDVPLYERVESYTELGLIAERLQENGWEEAADEYFEDSFTLWMDTEAWEEAFGEEYSDYRRAVNDEAAQARFHQAEYVFEEFLDVRLEFPPERLSELATQKAELQQEAEAYYREIIQETGSPRWISAAAFRRGQSYRDFAEALFDLPLPEGLTPDQEFEYEMSVQDFALPLQEQSLDSFERALELALRYEAYNEWSARSAAEISDLESGSFPVTEQDGVDPTHFRVEFFAPDPVRDRDVVRQRGADRFERLRPEEPDPDLEPGHPHYDPELDRDSPEFNPEKYQEIFGPPEGEEGEGEPQARRGGQ